MLTTVKQFNNKLGLNKWSTKEKKILLILTLKEDNINICVCGGNLFDFTQRYKKWWNGSLIKYYHTKSIKDDQIYYSATKKKRKEKYGQRY